MVIPYLQTAGLAVPVGANRSCVGCVTKSARLVEPRKMGDAR